MSEEQTSGNPPIEEQGKDKEEGNTSEHNHSESELEEEQNKDNRESQQEQHKDDSESEQEPDNVDSVSEQEQELDKDNDSDSDRSGNRGDEASDSGEDAISLSSGSELVFDDEADVEEERHEVASKPEVVADDHGSKNGKNGAADPLPGGASLPVNQKGGAASAEALPAPSVEPKPQAAAATARGELPSTRGAPGTGAEPESSAEEGELVGESAEDYAEIASHGKSDSNGGQISRYPFCLVGPQNIPALCLCEVPLFLLDCA